MKSSLKNRGITPLEAETQILSAKKKIEEGIRELVTVTNDVMQECVSQAYIAEAFRRKAQSLEDTIAHLKK